MVIPYFHLIKVIGIVENCDFKELCYEALKEILPAGNNAGIDIINRSKIWKIITAEDFIMVSLVVCY